MEIFRIEKEEYFDLEMWAEKLNVKPGDLLVIKANKPVPEDIVHDTANRFVDFIQHDERFQNVKIFVMPDPDINLSFLKDEELASMGLMRIPEKKTTIKKK